MSHKKGKLVKNPTQKVEQVIRIPPLVEAEGRYFQGLVDASNRYTALLKQKSQYDYALSRLYLDRERVVKGEVSFPMNITLIPKMITYPENDKKKILTMFDEQIAVVQSTLTGLTGQIEHRYEEYKESAIRTKEFLNRRFKDVMATNIATERKVIPDETTLFEAEFSELLEKTPDGKPNPLYNPKKVEALQKVRKDITKKSVSRKTKK